VDLNELEAWFQERPKWMQDAARRLVQNGTFNDEDIADFFAICNAEAAVQKVDFNGLPAGALGVVRAGLAKLDSDISGEAAL